MSSVVAKREEWLRNWTPLAVDYEEYDPLRAGSIDGTDSVPHDRGIVRAMNSTCESSEPKAATYIIAMWLLLAFVVQ